MEGEHEVEFIDLTGDSSGLESATSLSESFVSNFEDENTLSFSESLVASDLESTASSNESLDASDLEDENTGNENIGTSEVSSQHDACRTRLK